MQQIVSITSQGQITIPASIRRSLGLNKYPKATVYLKNKKIIIEPIPDILTMGGLLKRKAIKGKSIDKTIKLEEKVISETISKNIFKIND